ncbi:putative periplasmic protein [Enhygromyxa salina]|uniref:Putative periplasmic protein n=2 Tax=Enhygromyxa salina TaxID=215803 RepID=A0A0C2D5Z8_9BACT|nr:putative periplasmic protein [Enhygromyxa salina]
MALFTLGTAALFGCTEPSGTPTPAVEPHPPAAQVADPTPSEDPAVLATGDPAAVGEEEAAADAVAVGDEVEAGEEAPEEPVALLEPRRVLIVGSSLAATGFGAVLEDMLDANPDIVAYRKAKSASGLSRPDFFDWDDQGKRQVEFRKPDLVIVFMGANDGQDIAPWKSESRVVWDTDGWPAAYRGRVDNFLASVTTPVEGEDGAQVLWLSLPRVTSPSLERKLKVIREIHEQGVGALGDAGLYLDTNQYLIDDQGALLKTIKVKGKQQELRSEDGVHFTMSGCEYLAAKIYPDVLVALGLPAEPSSEPSSEPSE